jgi:hypothetical protein
VIIVVVVVVVRFAGRPATCLEHGSRVFDHSHLFLGAS